MSIKNVNSENLTTFASLVKGTMDSTKTELKSGRAQLPTYFYGLGKSMNGIIIVIPYTRYQMQTINVNIGYGYGPSMNMLLYPYFYEADGIISSQKVYVNGGPEIAGGIALIKGTLKYDGSTEGTDYYIYNIHFSSPSNVVQVTASVEGATTATMHTDNNIVSIYGYTCDTTLINASYIVGPWGSGYEGLKFYKYIHGQGLIATEIGLESLVSNQLNVLYAPVTTVGSATQPVYFDSSGIATACEYTLNKSVPSTAIFTDTTYSAGTGLTLSSTTFNLNLNNATKASYASSYKAATSSNNFYSLLLDKNGKLSTFIPVVASNPTLNLTSTDVSLGSVGDTNFKVSITPDIGYYLNFRDSDNNVTARILSASSSTTKEIKLCVGTTSALVLSRNSDTGANKMIFYLGYNDSIDITPRISTFHLENYSGIEYIYDED